MPKTCKYEECYVGVFSKGYCMRHWKQFFGKPITRKRSDKPLYSTKTIKAVSTRQQRLNAAYSAQRLVYLKNHRICEAALTNCTFEATDIHHMKGRSEYLLDEKFFLPVCRSCHSFIEENPAYAKSKGLSLDRLTKV